MAYRIILPNIGEIDMYDDVKMSLKRTNHCLPLGKMSMDRTSTFEVPATPNNRRIFNLAGNVYVDAIEKEATYTNITAILLGSGIAWEGWLYIAEAKSEEYTLLFTFGELVPLSTFLSSKVREYNQISTITTDWYTIFTNEGAKNKQLWSGEYMTPSIAPAQNMTYKDMILLQQAYRNVSGIVGLYHFPCVNWRYLLASACEKAGISLNLSSLLARVSVVNEFKLAEAPAKWWQAISGGVVRTNMWVDGYNYGGNVIYNDRKEVYTYYYASIENFRNGVVFSNPIYCQYFDKSVKMQLPPDFPQDVFICSIGWNSDAYHNVPQDGLRFYGGYSFKYDNSATPIISGSPLAGREIEIPAYNDYWYNESDTNKQHPNTNAIFFVKASDYKYLYDDQNSAWQELGLALSVSFSLSQAINVSLDFGRLELGENINDLNNVYYYPSDLLPDATYMQILTSYALSMGRCIDLRNGIDFAKFADNRKIIDLSKNLISIENVTTGVFDFPESVVFKFDYNDNVTEEVKDATSKKMLSLNIDKNEDEVDIPFSGVYSESLADVGDLVPNSDEPTGYEIVSQNQTLLYVNADGVADGTPLNVDNIMTQIFSNSQKVKVKLFLRAIELEQLDDFTIIQINCIRYFWSEITWSENIATATLQKVD